MGVHHRVTDLSNHRQRHGDVFPDIFWQHKDTRIPTKSCKICTANKIRSETTWECKQCLIVLQALTASEVPHYTRLLQSA